MMEGARSVWVWQGLIALAVSLGLGLWMGAMVVASFVWGAALAMASGYFLARRVTQAAAADRPRGQRLLYAGAVWRFLGVLAGLVLAWGLGLHLLVVAAGMLLAQVVMFVVAALDARRAAMNAKAEQTRE